MDARLKTFLGVTGALTLIVMGLPTKGETPDEPAPASGTLTVEAGVEPSSVPVARVPLDAATKEQRAAQSARLLALEWTRDPFVPVAPASPPPEVELPPEPEPLTEPEPAPEISAPPTPAPPPLRGIMRRGERWSALVGPHVIVMGDRLPTGHEVTAISATTVILVHTGETTTLTLGASR